MIAATNAAANSAANPLLARIANVRSNKAGSRWSVVELLAAMA